MFNSLSSSTFSLIMRTSLHMCNPTMFQRGIVKQMKLQSNIAMRRTRLSIFFLCAIAQGKPILLFLLHLILTSEGFALNPTTECLEVKN